jgi:hypothetical protein
MPRSPGNTQLKAARQHAGYGSQQAFAEALTRAAEQLELGRLQVSVRQVRRWESASPPWPRSDHQRLLVHVLHLPIERLGFTPPWADEHTPQAMAAEAASRMLTPHAASGLPLPLPTASSPRQPSTAGSDYAIITGAHRRLYWTVQPAQLHPAVTEHARLGRHLLAETADPTRRTIAISLAESLLLAARIEFFDLRQPSDADSTLIAALQAAGEANDPLLGSAILAHAAFIPGWAGERDDAAERMRAARTYSRRADPPSSFLAWLDAVEAECETRCGNPRQALRIIANAEDVLTQADQRPFPPWFDWFSPTRLASFKGNTQLRAGHLPQARETLLTVLEALPSDAGKQRSVVLGDLASVEAAAKKPEEACAYAQQALSQLALTWYATGMDRIRDVRRALQPWADRECVQLLDDRLYGWQATISALQS